MSLTRMCSCCRKEVATAAESLTLNGVFAHIACVTAGGGRVKPIDHKDLDALGYVLVESNGFCTLTPKSLLGVGGSTPEDVTRLMAERLRAKALELEMLLPQPDVHAWPGQNFVTSSAEQKITKALDAVSAIGEAGKRWHDAATGHLDADRQRNKSVTLHASTREVDAAILNANLSHSREVLDIRRDALLDALDSVRDLVDDRPRRASAEPV